MRELPVFPNVTLHGGDTLEWTWEWTTALDDGVSEGTLVDYRVIPDPRREADALAELRADLDDL